jgi:ABC-type dipeptide/oligopeptide/nickel transport system permease subunit
MSEANATAQASTVQNSQTEEDLTYGDIVWGQLRKNKFAIYSLYLLIGLFAVAIYSPLVASDRPFIWTENGETTYPWFSSLFDRNYFENAVDIFFNLLLVTSLPLMGLWFAGLKYIQKSTPAKRPRRRKIQNMTFAAVGFVLLTYGAILAKPSEAPYRTYYEDYIAAQEDDSISIEATFTTIPFGYRKTGFKSLDKPSAKHWLGVDQSTRDVAVRMLYGTRIALSIGVIAVSIYVSIGIFIGAMAGYFGGIIDLLVVRFIEIFMSIPSLFVILTLLAFVEKPSIFHIMLVIGLLSWTGVARLVRGEFLRLRNLDFVNAAIALGFPTRRIIFQHILPNALGPVLVNATFGVASAILTESTLSFLGLGDPSVPSWGQTLSEGYATSAWHLILTPGIAIFITVSLLNQLGDGVRSALDPKARK